MPSLIRHKNGRWYFTFYEDGRQRWKSLKTADPVRARELYKQLDARHTLGLLGLPGKQKNPILSEIFAEYLPFCKNHKAPRTYRDAEMQIRLFLGPVFGHIRARELGPRHVEAFIGQMRTADYHPRTINLRLETLRKVLRRAVENKVLSQMPCKIKMLKEPDSLPRYATPDHIKDWMGYLDIAPRLRAILSLMTGITDRDMGYIMLDGYDRHNALLRFRRPKTTTDIVVPLTQTAMQIMGALVKDNPGPRLFPAASARRAFNTASKNAVKHGGKKLTPHMLRHSFATWLLSIGVPLAHLQQILGHKTIKTTERYARVMPGHLRATMDKIEAKEFDIQALLSLPKKADGRAGGKRWTEEQRRAQAAAMKGNKRRIRKPLEKKKAGQRDRL